jgi:hypothetical protein
MQLLHGLCTFDFISDIPLSQATLQTESPKVARRNKTTVAVAVTKNCQRKCRLTSVTCRVPACGGPPVSAFGVAFGFGAGAPSDDFLATALIFLSIFSSSVITHELFIPASAHFFSRQAWQVFLQSVLQKFIFFVNDVSEK